MYKLMDIKSVLLAILLLLSADLFAQSNSTSNEYAYKWKSEIIATDAPRSEGTRYRIELITVRHYNPNDPDLKSLSQHGKIYPERSLTNGNIKLMLGNMKSLEEAKVIERKLKNMGFTTAKTIRYREGFRVE